jgi:hypothetical protein
MAGCAQYQQGGSCDRNSIVSRSQALLPKSWPLFDLRKKFSEPIADLGFVLLQNSGDSLLIGFSRSMAPSCFHLAPKFGKQTVRS